MLGAAPERGVLPGKPPSAAGPSVNRFLWVISTSGVPYVLEAADAAKSFFDGVAKHTNLTGGAAACCGGEIWFEADPSVAPWVSGGSGRYGPQSDSELSAAVSALQEMGFKAVSLGWDPGTKTPSRVLR